MAFRTTWLIILQSIQTNDTITKLIWLTSINVVELTGSGKLLEFATYIDFIISALKSIARLHYSISSAEILAKFSFIIITILASDPFLLTRLETVVQRHQYYIHSMKLNNLHMYSYLAT